MITSKLAVCFTAMTLLLLGSCVTPEEPLPTPPPVTKETTTDYQPTLDRQIAYYRDTVHISGKNFGTRPTRIAVYLDSIYILPLNVVDTRVSFIIPTGTPLRKYNVSMKILDDEIRNFSTITIMGEQWGDFISAEFSASLHGAMSFRVFKQGGGFIDTTATNYTKVLNYSVASVDSIQKLIHPSISNNSLVYDFSSSYSYNYSPLKVEHTYRSATNTFRAVIDTFTKTASAIVISSVGRSSYSSAFGSNYDETNFYSFELQSGTYKEITNGIEILISGNDLLQCITKSHCYIDYFPDPNLTNWKFIAQPPYQQDDYIKIVLKRK